MAETTRGYRELIVWQKAMQLVPEVYRLVKQLPAEERYALSDQLRRAVVSIPAEPPSRKRRWQLRSPISRLPSGWQGGKK